MGKWDNLYLLIEQVEALMDSMLTSGFNVTSSGVIDSITEAYESCENIGLSFLGENLKEITEALERKSHDINYNYDDVISKYFLVSSYTEIIKNKLEIERAKEYMKSDKMGEL